MSFTTRTGMKGSTGMKKPSSKIREEIARLQEQLKHAETREAERIGRIALKAGLGEMEVDEPELQAALENLASRFLGGKGASGGKKVDGDRGPGAASSAPHGSGATTSGAGEA
jgi:TraC-like protein